MNEKKDYKATFFYHFFQPNTMRLIGMSGTRGA